MPEYNRTVRYERGRSNICERTESATTLLSMRDLLALVLAFRERFGRMPSSKSELVYELLLVSASRYHEPMLNQTARRELAELGFDTGYRASRKWEELEALERSGAVELALDEQTELERGARELGFDSIEDLRARIAAIANAGNACKEENDE
jgi:hypothetical protein